MKAFSLFFLTSHLCQTWSRSDGGKRGRGRGLWWCGGEGGDNEDNRDWDAGDGRKDEGGGEVGKILRDNLLSQCLDSIICELVLSGGDSFDGKTVENFEIGLKNIFLFRPATFKAYCLLFRIKFLTF